MQPLKSLLLGSSVAEGSLLDRSQECANSFVEKHSDKAAVLHWEAGFQGALDVETLTYF